MSPKRRLVPELGKAGPAIKRDQLLEGMWLRKGRGNGLEGATGRRLFCTASVTGSRW